MPPPYKLPGGYVKAGTITPSLPLVILNVHTGEALGDAAEREVEEETGVKSQFQGLLTFRFVRVLSNGQTD